MAASSLLAILLVPAWLAVLGAQLDYPVSLRPDRAALVLAKSFLLPLALGMVVRGLSQVLGVVKQLGGGVRIETCLGKGTTVSMYPNERLISGTEVPTEPSAGPARARL
jgi:hypothetical protein